MAVVMLLILALGNGYNGDILGSCLHWAALLAKDYAWDCIWPGRLGN